MRRNDNFEIDFLFVGPQRTGTTWIYEHLKEHRSLCFPKGVKETMFFDKNFEKGIEWYNWHFDKSKVNSKYGEISPTYFAHQQAPSRVKQYFPDCKIIISLRDPVERARSLYQHHFQKGRVKGSFTEAIRTRPDILKSGYYADHIERWFSYFNNQQILIISTNDIKNNPDQLLNNICEFLKINVGLLPSKIKREKINTAQRPRFYLLAKIGSELVSKLHSLRLHWIVNLAKKIGLKKLFFRKDNEKPILTDNEREYLNREYSSHIDYVNRNFKNISL